MNKFITTLVLIFGITATAWHARADDRLDFHEVDKQAHVAVSYGIALTATRILETKGLSRGQAILDGSLITLGLGLIKEFIIDASPSGADMAANGVGVGASALVVWTFQL